MYVISHHCKSYIQTPYTVIIILLFLCVKVVDDGLSHCAPHHYPYCG